MFVSFHGINEERHQRLQAFAADSIRRLPDHNQRLTDRIVIKSARWSRRAPLDLLAAEYPHGVLAVKAGHRCELIQDAAFLAPLAGGVSLAYRCH
jgi:hypothetical protein